MAESAGHAKNKIAGGIDNRPLLSRLSTKIHCDAIMAWDSDLDPASPAYRIAADNSRYIRVLAGPGTGKSFALKRRVARLLESNVLPSSILPVTFTKVAAEDLQRELVNMRVPGCEEIRGS